ncbi:MAG: 16S rRNA (adenine(1518)-N(6)/adenine(1519)-N(6))-dimethyltransferase RsmA [Candidatus Micrarchaeia archaeon]
MQKGKPIEKKLSQNFLNSPEILQEEAELLSPQGEDVLEIGAGDGRLSSKIIALSPKSLTLVEIDEKWATLLQKKFRKFENVRILQQDFLELDNNFKTSLIYGNIPYHITSKILLKLAKMKFTSTLLLMQKEVVQRICSDPATSNYGRISVFCQLHYTLNPLFEVPRNLFEPPPKVDSQFLQLVPKSTSKLPKNLEETSSALFSHRLASVQNAILHSRKQFGWDKEQARQVAKTIKFADKKVFMLTPDEVVSIARVLGEKKDWANKKQNRLSK